jgi:hypothetical protein
VASIPEESSAPPVVYSNLKVRRGRRREAERVYTIICKESAQDGELDESQHGKLNRP